MRFSCQQSIHSSNSKLISIEIHENLFNQLNFISFPVDCASIVTYDEIKKTRLYIGLIVRLRAQLGGEKSLRQQRRRPQSAVVWNAKYSCWKKSRICCCMFVVR